jgi:hypothetical protein
MELTFKTPAGKIAYQVQPVGRAQPGEIVETGRPWSFYADGSLFWSVFEAQRMSARSPFDAVLAVHTSLVEPLSIQIGLRSHPHRRPATGGPKSAARISATRLVTSSADAVVGGAGGKSGLPGDQRATLSG